jgi:dipeptidyl aminopeptidase/acylaminoacyl peptidase
MTARSCAFECDKRAVIDRAYSWHREADCATGERMSRTIAPYGSWKSVISSSLLTSGAISLGQLVVRNGHVYWSEGRPLEGGRVAIVRNGVDVTPPDFNARTRAHEYGGGAYTVHADSVFFCNFVDQRLYRQELGATPRAITPEPPLPGSLRYADMAVTPDGSTVVCVRERHELGREAINELVALPADGSRDPWILAEGHDFYSSPRISPDGRRLAWLTWDHPNMPWDSTELWIADFDRTRGLSGIQKIAGSGAESIFQPEWSSAGVLCYVSDRTGWWNLYSQSGPLAPMEAEFGLPQWIFGLSRYGFLSGDRIACIYSKQGLDHLAVPHTRTGSLEAFQLPYTSYADLCTDGDSKVYLIAGSAAVPLQVVSLNVRDGSTLVLKSSMSVSLDPEDLSAPEPIEYPTTNNRTAHALFYPPKNSKYAGPADEKPPLLVISHGGPTSATTSNLRLSLQYWTNRGFAVVDVDYGGSSGYGREYRERLNGMWGIVDVEDCINALRYLAARGDIDPRRAAIRGGSAGGYTTLCALVFHNVFAAGASHFGVGDLAALVRDTHKFESRYLDKLVGPYPAAADVYRERSPIYFADRISCPVILLQGLEDKVVPPNQAETFVAALRSKGLAHEYVTFPNEGHGFRRADSIQRAAEAELEFYARVFGFPTKQQPSSLHNTQHINGQ